ARRLRKYGGNVMAMPDYYAILEVAPTATPTDIKRSYRRLVRRYHPDLNQQAAGEGSEASAASKQIKMLNEAYEVLSNPEKRALYGARRRAAEERRTVDKEAHQRKQAQQAQAKQESKMTWIEGVFGFVRELKRALREE